MRTSSELSPTPHGMRIQLERLFGTRSREAQMESRSDSEWRRTFERVLSELERYIDENVNTDQVHYAMLLSGPAAARRSLEEDENFWPGYVEGLTRTLFLLLGDYPDHRDMHPGHRKRSHYALRRYRTVGWQQTPKQKLNTLLDFHELGAADLRVPPRRALDQFRKLFGSELDYRDFFDWYRTTLPDDYAKLF